MGPIRTGWDPCLPWSGRASGLGLAVLCAWHPGSSSIWDNMAFGPELRLRGAEVAVSRALLRSRGAAGLSRGSGKGSPHQLPAIKDTVSSPWEMVK